MTLFEKNLFEEDEEIFRSLFDDLVIDEGDYLSIPKEKIVEYLEFFDLDAVDIDVEEELQVGYSNPDLHKLEIRFEGLGYDGEPNLDKVQSLEEDLEASTHVDKVDVSDNKIVLTFTQPVETD